MLLIGSCLVAALATVLLVAVLRMVARFRRHAVMIAVILMAGLNLAAILAYIDYRSGDEPCTELCAGLMFVGVLRHWLVTTAGSAAASFACSLYLAGRSA